MKNEEYTSFNAGVWDNIHECLTSKSTAISPEAYAAAKNGALDVTIAGTALVPRDWFPELRGLDILGLASGGGQQCPVFAAHGANVTVMDFSGRQLALGSLWRRAKAIRSAPSGQTWQSRFLSRTIPLT